MQNGHATKDQGQLYLCFWDPVILVLGRRTWIFQNSTQIVGQSITLEPVCSDLSVCSKLMGAKEKGSGVTHSGLLDRTSDAPEVFFSR